MMKEIKYFKRQARYWGKKLGIEEIDLIEDSDMWHVAESGKYDDGSVFIAYNPSELKGIKHYYLLHIVFHELGHLKSDFFNVRNDLDLIICEYLAESQAWKWMKKYYPKHYKSLKKVAKQDIEHTLTYPKKYNYYFLAFSQIPEYQEVL